jgi:hypothetical protein
LTPRQRVATFSGTMWFRGYAWRGAVILLVGWAGGFISGCAAEAPPAIEPAADLLEIAAALNHPVVAPAHGARADGGLSRNGPEYPAVRFLVFSDLHHLSSDLWTDSPAFRRWLATNDGKVLARSAELLDAIVEQVMAETRREPLDFVVITGDLTANGELESHLDVAVAAATIRAAGVPVYVIP